MTPGTSERKREGKPRITDRYTAVHTPAVKREKEREREVKQTEATLAAAKENELENITWKSAPSGYMRVGMCVQVRV